MASLPIVYASTSGHTEYVVDTLIAFLKERLPSLVIGKKCVELATATDLDGDFLILASSTWNTGGPEGQLNPHMYAFVYGPGKDVVLKGKKVAVIGLGDARYYYTCRAAEHLEKYVKDHGGTVVAMMKIINEPYGQEAKVRAWGEKLLEILGNGEGNRIRIGIRDGSDR
ncbi:MAG: flavodoxin family protein [Candidatus Peregrinibacteria bacterium]|nr:flavodoxin family protein [Candidatus Peregrinibacteria bacterium]